VVFSTSAWMLGAALMAAQAQAPPPAQSPVAVQAPPENTQRPTGRTQRPSTRQPSASGQGSVEQARTSRDGGPTRQELTFTANLLAGYDDNLTAGLGSGSGTSPAAMVSGTTASVDGTLGYFRGNSLRSFQLDTTGSLVGYPDNLENPAPAGSLNASGRTPMGRATTLGLSGRVSYQPLFSVLSPGAGTGPLPPGVAQPAPTTGLFERKSLSSSAGVSLDRRWGRRDTTTLGYTYRMQEFTDDDYGDSAWHDVAASYRRIASSQVKAGADYRYRSGEYRDSQDLARPTVEHRVEGVTEFMGTPSRRRSYSILLAAGVRYLELVSASGATSTSWLPVGRTRLTLDVSSNWSIEGGYQRELSLLQGVTDEVYTTDTASVTTKGMLSRRAALMIGATYSNWVTTVASGVRDTMNVYGATLGLRFLLTDSLAATANYHYYLHRYSNPASLPAGFPAEFDRRGVRVGLSMFFPLAGSTSRQVSRW